MVLIAGAGPAGLRAGINLLNAGVECIIIEKEILPRRKVCSGLLTEKVYRLFDDFPDDCILSSTNKIEITKKGKLVVRVRTEHPFRVINRELFDYYLWQAYLEAGGKVIDGTAVIEVIDDENKVILVNAAGHKSAMYYDSLVYACGCETFSKKQYRLSHKVAVCAHTVIYDPKGKTDVTLDLGYVKDGYCFRFPTSDTESLVGLGSLDFDINKLTEFLSLLNINKNSIDPEVASIPYGYSPLLLENLEKAKKKVYIIGDSAGLVDPLTAEGMYFALKSADYASKAIIVDDINPFTANMRIAYKTIEEAQALRGLVFATRDLTLKLAKMKPNFLSFILDEVVSLYNIPYKPFEIIKRYKLSK